MGVVSGRISQSASRTFIGSSLEEALEVVGVVGSVTVTSTGNATHLKCTGENVTVVFDTFLGDAPALAFSEVLVDLLGPRAAAVLDRAR